MHSFMIAPMRRQKVAIAFGRVLREARKLKGLSQEELAADAEFDRTYPSLLERGLRTPTLTVLFQLAKVLEADVDQLLLMAEKIPDKIRRRVLERPEAFRLIADLDDKSLDRLLAALKAR